MAFQLLVRVVSTQTQGWEPVRGEIPVRKDAVTHRGGQACHLLFCNNHVCRASSIGMPQRLALRKEQIKTSHTSVRI